MEHIQKNLRIFARAIFMICLASIPAAAFCQTFYDNEYQWANNDPTLNVRRSDHFRFIWGNGTNPSTSGEYTMLTEQLVQGDLQAYEHAWHQIFDAPPYGVGFRQPNESINPEYRDGKYYRANMTYNKTGIYDGGGWGTVDGYGFPWFAVNPGGMRYDPQPDASFHEYIHSVLINCAGFNNSPWDGMWHEATNDWLDDQTYCYAGMGGYASWHHFTLPNGRAYYDAYLLNELIMEDPALGTQFTVNVWTQANGDQAKGGETMFDAMIRLWPAGESDPTNALKDRIGQMAARNVTWDYKFKQYYRMTTSYVMDASPFNSMWRRGTTELVLQPGSTTWYRPPFEHAPCEGGYDICPIQLTGKSGAGYSVSVDFQPLWDSVRKSDWRACFVAVNTAGDARYSNMWNSGINTITLSADENTLYLVVAATPDFQAFNGFAGPLMTDAPTSPQPYMVRFVNTSASPYLVGPGHGTSGWHQHSNGLGWVANTATVDTTAYVGPNAVVFDNSKVQGYARVEDYAQVLTSAVVKDNAVVSGHAVIKDSAQIYGNAKVRDWATVDGNAQVYGNGKVLQHGYLTNTAVCYDDGVVKGCAWDFGDASTFGCAMKDADCSNYANISKGVLMGWVWDTNQSRADALADNGYLYCGYQFDTTSPNYALDKYGITYGYLIGKPSIVNGGATNRGSVLQLDGSTQYVELQRDVSDMKDSTIAVWAKWTGSANDQKIWSMSNGSTKYMYLTPKDNTTNKLRLVITDGTTTQYLDGAAAMPASTWTHVAITWSGSTYNTSTKQWTATATLYVNGTQVASANGILVPDQCNAADTAATPQCNYIGRGNSGGFFAGQIDEFRVYNKALAAADITALQTLAGGTVTTTSDTTAPTPNAATWLVAPTVQTGTSVVMSATKGTDASNYIEYYFTCTAGGGHDSGWISNNRYMDSLLTPGTTYTYNVKMRDKAGNTTTASADMSVTVPADTAAPTPNAATFSVAPKGISTSAIRMTATVGTDASNLVEYKFDRYIMPGGSSVLNSGWQTSPTWTDTGLVSGTTYYYSVTMRDAYGNTGTVSARSSTAARDNTPPTRYTYGEWTTYPFATIDRKMCMRARSLRGMTANGTDTNSDDWLSLDIAGELVYYYFHCVSGGGPDSGWQVSNSYTTPVLPDGTYQYQFKIKDASGNETPYSSIESGSITPTNSYHDCTFAQALTLPDEYLVTFSGVVMRVNSDNYIVRDMSTGNNLTVKPHLATNSAFALKTCQIQGHLLTLGGTRIVTTATVTSTGTPTSYTISGRVTNTSGAGISGATVYFSDTSNAAVNPVTTVTCDSNGYYSKSVPNPSNWYVAAGSALYNTSADQTVSVNGANVGNINFVLVSNTAVSGKVTKKSDGTAISGASVYFSTSPNAFMAPAYTATTDSNGNYTQPLQNGTWYICSSASGYWTTPDVTVTMNSANITGKGFALKPNTRSIPQTGSLLFSAITDTFPASGSTGAWATYQPPDLTLTMMGSPTVDVINGVKYESNLRADYDGYVFGSAYSSPITVNGASIVAVVKPTRNSISGDAWNSIVDVFYDRLVLSILNNTGQVVVRRNGTPSSTGYYIPDGQVTVLSLVCQSNGNYKVYANGTQVYSNTTSSTMTSLVPNVPGPFACYINVGRNNPDAWSTFNGDIGDVFLYSVALSTTERQQIETDLSAKFRGLTITSSAGTGGSISPSGLACMNSGDSQSYTITPNTGYNITQVTVDGVNKGAVGGWSFTNVTANHTISATFTPTALTINASAGANGTISPSGAVSVNYGASQAFTITPNAGYGIATLSVDGVSITPTASYTFSNVTAGHTISATFAKPVGVNNKSLRASILAAGKLVKVWGKVKSIAGDNLSFAINDGSGADVTVNFNGVSAPTGFAVGKMTLISGIVNSNKSIQAQSIVVYP